ncbi:uncharacterized protein [Triticum aestivum]|uniref:uncharacterized protein n=1 Tax=Triticum aestivum TaxID=4565 RepID=UPI001D001B58|nr:uncharacterized protein LOC123100737 [Triticum aestivum]
MLRRRVLRTRGAAFSGTMVHLGILLNRCPCLRVLKVTGSTPDITVHSATLQELDISSDHDTTCYNIDVVTPVLKKLQLKLHASWNWNNISVSISTPMVEEVSWKCSYPRLAFSVGFWSLESLAIETTERYIDTRNDTCSQVQKLSRFHVLRLPISCTTNHLGAQLNFAREIQKLPVIIFPVLELYFISSGHVYGALVMHLLQINRIHSSTKMLKVIQWLCPKVRQTCQENCRCDEPNNWRSQSISLTCLEELEITGFNAEDHEHDFVRLILRSAPMLKRVTLTLVHEFRGCPMKIYNIFLAHRSVNCYVYNSTGELVPRASR